MTAKPTTPPAAESALNPFNADLVAALDSPRYTNGEHRIAFSDQSNGVEGHVYGKTLAMALARAEFVIAAVNAHAAAQQRIVDLTEEVADYHWLIGAGAKWANNSCGGFDDVRPSVIRAARLALRHPST